MNGIEDVRQAFASPEDVPPYDPQDPRAPDQDPPEGDADPIDPASECVSLPLNDFGNGQRFNTYFGENVLFVPRVGWFCWDGRYWAQDDDKLVVRSLAQKVAAEIQRETEFLRLEDWEQEMLDDLPDARKELRAIEAKPRADRSDEEKSRMDWLRPHVELGEAMKAKLKGLQKSHLSHAKRTGNTQPINNMLTEAQVGVYKTLDVLNADPLMINTKSGVIRFFYAEDPLADFANPTGAAAPKIWQMEVMEHRRDHYLSKIMDVEFDAQAQCPKWLAFLEQIQPDQELRDFLQRWLGYSLTGRTDEQKLAFFYGGGRNGKSTLVDLIARMMADYTITLPIESLTGAETRKGSDATPDLVRVPGARMVRASEPEQGQKMKEAMIKQLTGGEAILVRRMQQEFIEVTPEFKLTIQGNHKPDIRGTDDGIWRRILLVPFLVQVAKEDVNPNLPKELWEERSGILNWMLEGARQWLTDGLQEPAAVLDATEEYREESDPVGVFINEVCIVDGDENKFTRGRDLKNAFNFWMEDRGLAKWGERTVANHFKAKSQAYKSPSGHGFHPLKRSDTGYCGIALSDVFKSKMERAETVQQYGVAPEAGEF